MVTWKHADGTTTVVNSSLSDEELLRVLQEALRSLRGRFPSINSSDVIDDILDYLDDHDGLVTS